MLPHKKTRSLILTSFRTVEDRITVLIFRGADIRRKTANNFFFFSFYFLFLSLFSFLCLSSLMLLLICAGFWWPWTVHNFCECRLIHNISYVCAAWYPNRGFYVETKINKNVLSRTILHSKTTCCWIPYSYLYSHFRTEANEICRDKLNFPPGFCL